MVSPFTILALNVPWPGVDSEGVSSNPVRRAENRMPPFPPWPRSAIAAATNAIRPAATSSEIATASLRMLLLPVRLCTALRAFVGAGFVVVEMPVDELLDLGRPRSAFEPRDGAPALDQDQGRNEPDIESLGQVGLLLDVDPRDAQPVPLLARKVREEALHPPGRPRVPRGEEHEKVPASMAGWFRSAGHWSSCPRPHGARNAVDLH